MSIDYIEAINNVNKLDLANNTKSNLKSLLNKLNKNKIENSNEIYNYLLSIRQGTNPATYYSYVSSIISLMNKDIIPTGLHYEKIEELFNELKLLRDKTRTTTPTNKQTDNFIELAELQKKVKTIKNATDKLLISLYVDIPPVRLDYANIRIVDKLKDIPTEDDLQNYYAMYENTIVLRDYKTKKAYGEYRYKLLPKHKVLIKTIVNDTGQQYLFINPNTKQPYSNNTFGVYLTKVFNTYYNKPITLLDLRHIYASHYSLEKYGIDVVKQVSNRMLHSVGMNVIDYQKIF
jgi:integrase